MTSNSAGSFNTELLTKVAIAGYPPRTRNIYISPARCALSTVLAMSAGMINQEGVNVDLYIPRKCAAVPA